MEYDGIHGMKEGEKMGFKCPSCHKDFGHDRSALTTHLKLCAGFDVENINIEVFGTEYSKQLLYDSTIKPIKNEIDRLCDKAGDQE